VSKKSKPAKKSKPKPNGPPTVVVSTRVGHKIRQQLLKIGKTSGWRNISEVLGAAVTHYLKCDEHISMRGDEREK